MKKYSIILAVDEKNGIGKNNTIPWRLKKEQQYFKEITIATKNTKKQNAVVMGRKTWESLPRSVRPLPGRVNFVLSSNYKENPNIIEENTYGFNSFEKCCEYISKDTSIDKVFIIGGSYLYNLVLDSDLLDKIYLTRVYGDFHCDVFFSDIPKYFKITKTSKVFKEGDISYQMFEYKNKENILAKLGKPALITGGIIFVLCVAFLLFQTFSPSKQTPGETQNIGADSNQERDERPLPQDSTINVPLQNQDPQEIPSEENTDSQSDISTPQEPEPSPDEVVNRGDFQVEQINRSGITIFYPQTNIPQLQSQIDEYIKGKNLEYKILLFNQKNAGIEAEIVLDYEVVSDETGQETIVFTDTLGKQKISTQEFIVIKQ